jgi:hypothetical protein
MSLEKLIALIDDPALLKLLEVLAKSDSAVLLVTIHKKRVVKIQPVSKENLVDMKSGSLVGV